MSFVARLRAKSRRPAVAPAGDDRDLIAFFNEARTDAERQAVIGLAALRRS
jgi:hypothetical protein